jgi:hypothetical protein
MEDQLKNIPTIVLSELPQSEREKYFNFLLENEVQFTEDPSGYYTAIIKVVNTKGTKKTETLPQAKLEKSRFLDSTFSYKQKTVISESPRSLSPSSFSKSIKSRDTRSKSPVTRRPVSPNLTSGTRAKGVTDILEQDTSLNTVSSYFRGPGLV